MLIHHVAYSLISEARGLEKKYQYFRVLFKTEQYRLLEWANVAGIEHNDGIFLRDRNNRAVVIDVLDEQYRLIMSFGALNKRYAQLSKPLLCEVEHDEGPGGRSRPGIADEDLHDDDAALSRFPDSNKLLQKALDLTRRTKNLPRRLRWAQWDQKEMENLVQQLGRLNDNLRDILSSHQMILLRKQEDRTGFQIIQLNNKMEQLLEIIQAGAMMASPRPGASKSFCYSTTASLAETVVEHDDISPVQGSNSLQENLLRLAKFKAVCCTVDEGRKLDDTLRATIGLRARPCGRRLIEINEQELELDNHQGLNQATKTARQRARYEDTLSGKRRQVWIEWRCLEPQHAHIPGDRPSTLTLRRFEALVTLLRENEVTSQFSAPRCLGYTVHKAQAASQYWCGIVFENPDGVSPSSPPISLREIIQSGRRAPSLTVRTGMMRTLAECVERLHAVNWLHKGLRSENIIFFQDEADNIDFSKPCLSGFDYSRPSTSASLSEGPAANLSEDLYRHPQVQGAPADHGSTHGYRRHHDIYSLGLILTEIAYWKPLEAMLGFSDLASLTAKDVLGVKEMLLSRSYRESLQIRLGDTIADVIDKCVDAAAEFSEDRESGRGKEENAQARFYDSVVKELAAIRI